MEKDKETESLLGKHDAPVAHNPTVDLVRFLVALQFVCFVHCNPLTNTVSGVVAEWGAVGPNLLAALAGFLVTLGFLPRESGEWVDTPRYYFATIGRLLPPYWVALFLVVWINPIPFVGSVNVTVPHLILSIALLQNWNLATVDTYPIHPVGKFFSTLTFLLLVFPVFARLLPSLLPSRGLRVVAAVLLWPVHLLVHEALSLPTTWETVLPLLHLPAFVIGMLGAMLLLDDRQTSFLDAAPQGNSPLSTVSWALSHVGGLVVYVGLAVTMCVVDPLGKDVGPKWAMRTGNLAPLLVFALYWTFHDNDLCTRALKPVAPFANLLGRLAVPMLLATAPAQQMRDQLDISTAPVFFVVLACLTAILHFLVGEPSREWVMSVYESYVVPWLSPPNEQEEPKEKPPARMPALDPFRFFASVHIMVLHLFIPEEEGPLHNLCSWGFVQVSFFFILSGFVLTVNYQPKAATGFDVRGFIFKRIGRLVPLFWVSGLLMVYGDPDEYLNSELWWKLFKIVLTMLGLQVYEKDLTTWINYPAWGIGTFFVLYFLFPFLLPMLSLLRTRTHKLLAVLVLWPLNTVLFELFSSLYPIPDSFPLLHVPAFCIGMVAGALFIDPERPSYRPEDGKALHVLSRVGATLALVALLVFWCLQPIEFGWWRKQFKSGWLAPLQATFIYFLAVENDVLCYLFGYPSLAILGQVSYGIYLLHVPIFEFISRAKQDSFGLLYAATLVGLVLACLYGVEQPGARWVADTYNNWGRKRVVA